MPWEPEQLSPEGLLTREWLVTNGLGGFGSGTVSGAVTRRYHGLLVAALPAPLGRCVMWTWHRGHSGVCRAENSSRIRVSSSVVYCAVSVTPH